MNSSERGSARDDEDRFEGGPRRGPAGEEAFGFLGDWFEDVDLEGMVRRYPLPALVLAAAGGFILGRTKGTLVLQALSTFAVGQVAQQVNAALGEDLL